VGNFAHCIPDAGVTSCKYRVKATCQRIAYEYFVCSPTIKGVENEPVVPPNPHEAAPVRDGVAEMQKPIMRECDYIEVGCQE
jgi:hypothetical protein